MKVDPIHIISIPGKSGGTETLKDIQKGAELPARIIERIGAKEALLEIAGKRIRAQFLKGLPAGSTVTLKLSEVRNSTYLFSMVDPSGKDALAKQVGDVTIFSLQQIQRNLLPGVGTALARMPAGILELNALLLGMRPAREKREEGIAGLLSRLLKLGVSSQAVSGLSVLLPGTGFDHEALVTLLSLLVPGSGPRGRTSPGREEIGREISGLLREIESLPDPPTAREIISRVFALLSEQDDAPAGYYSGEFAFRDGEEYRPVRYLGDGASWIFSMDLSNIGRTDMLAKKEERGYSLSVFAEDEQALSALKESSDGLRKKLADIQDGIYINFYISRQALNKIVEIYSHYSLHSVFDVKV